VESNWRLNCDGIGFGTLFPLLAARLVDEPEWFVVKLRDYPDNGFVMAFDPAFEPLLQWMGFSFILNPGEHFPWGFNVEPD